MPSANDTSGPEGFDQPAVEAWIAEHVPRLTPPLQWIRLQGGHSNLTYQLRDAAGMLAVIRRPPQGQLLPKAHDMSREWAVISALGPTSIPVPEALAFCESPAITGAWFYVMGWVEGRPLYSAADTLAWVPEDRRPTLAHSFFDVLADLHAVDPDAVGLGGLGKRDGYVARQLKTWYRSWTASVEPAQYDDPRAHALQRYFLDHLPEQGPARVVHGDYGLHNCLIGEDSRIAAVLDWEISTLGDPLADLAYALNQFPEAGTSPAGLGSATDVAGLPSRRELAQRYAERTSRDLSNLDYYIGFNRWKSAAILHGVYARYVEGKKSSRDVDLDEMRDRIDRTLELAEQAVQEVN
jgi:aminoglycoside phosphotransferase (APT) family kinase protein